MTISIAPRLSTAEIAHQSRSDEARWPHQLILHARIEHQQHAGRALRGAPNLDLVEIVTAK